MKEFIQKNPLLSVGAGLLAVLLAVVIARGIFGSSTPSVTEPASVSAQVLKATESSTVPASASPAGTGDDSSVVYTPPNGGPAVRIPTVDGKPFSATSGLPVTALTFTELVAAVNDTGTTATEAAINPATHVTAVAVGSGGVPDRIVSANYLDEQVDQLLSVYAVDGANVTVAPTSRTYTGVPGRPYGVAATTTGSTGTSFLAIMMWAIVGALLVWFIIRTVMYFRMRNSMGAGKSHTEGADRPSTRFADVAGCDEAVEDLQEIVHFLKDPQRFSRTGAKSPKGALLIGPPGTGKTLIARAVAGEAGVPFYAASGSDFVEMYVGVGAKRVRELFRKARQHEEGAIIFLDEVDAVGRKRSGSNTSGSNQETENTLNALLVEMDGFSESKVIVLAATNRDDMLDPALMRPGRLDRKVQVPLPDRLGREKIIKVHARNKPLADDVDLQLIARRTPGMSGAELEQIVNEACLFAARADRDIVTNEDFDHAVATIAMGKARTSAVVTEHDRLVTAWHEAGHATIGLVLPDAWDVTSISIIPRGVAGGVTWFAEGDDNFLTRRQAFARIVTAMGGRAAEELLLDGEFTSGPYGDLQQATNTAIAMITKYGMTEHGLAHRPDEILASGSQISDDVWEKADAILAEALEVARETLRSHRELFDALVTGLLEFDTLTASQIEEIRQGKPITPPALPEAPKEYRKEPSSDVPPPQAPTPPDSPRWGDPRERERAWGFGGRRKKRLAGAFGAAWDEWKRHGQGDRQSAR